MRTNIVITRLTRCFNSRRFLLILGALAVCIVLASTGIFTRIVKAVSEAAVFELEGDAKEDAAAGQDWQTVNATGYVANGVGGNAVAATGALPDMHIGSVKDDTAFFSMQTKDTVDIPGNWTFKSTSVPDKDDISNAYAAAFIPSSGPLSGHTIVTFGADRFSAGNGQAFLGFWFFQNDVHPNPATGFFTSKHGDGDTLVLVNFTGGGDIPVIQVLQWCEGCGDVSTNLKQIFKGSEKCGSDSGAPACAITNATSSVEVFWPYINKGPKVTQCVPSSTQQCFVEPVGFFEGALDLGSLPISPCISNFLAETRSSDSLTADLKDFVHSKFSLCGIEISKTCDAGAVNQAGNGFTYTYSGSVHNKGSITLSSLVVTDTFQATPTTTGTQTFSLSSLGGSATAPFSSFSGFTGSFDSSVNGGNINQASVTASGPGGLTFTASTGLVSCPVVDVFPSLKVVKNCDVNFDTAAGDVRVRVDFSGSVCNTSNVTLNNVTISDNPAASFDPPLTGSSINLGTLNRTGTAGDCKNYTGHYFPTTFTPLGPASGRASFTDSIKLDKAESALGGTVQSDLSMASATCLVCPKGQCPP